MHRIPDRGMRSHTAPDAFRRTGPASGPGSLRKRHGGKSAPVQYGKKDSGARLRGSRRTVFLDRSQKKIV